MRVEERILNKYDDLNETDLFIWNYIAKNRRKCTQLTIDSLAEKCNVSRTTISRFVKKLGFKGYSEFKIVLSWEDDNSKNLYDNAFEMACDSIIKYVDDQRLKNYESVCKLIYEAERIFVYGTGDIQNAVAKQMKRMFLSCQETIFNFEGTTFDKAFYNLVSDKDVMFIISLSGNSESAINIARHLKMNGTKIISITEFKDNKLTKIADETLYISATELSFLKEHPQFKTTMLYFVLIELLFIKYSIYKKNRTITEGRKCEI